MTLNIFRHFNMCQFNVSAAFYFLNVALWDFECKVHYKLKALLKNNIKKKLFKTFYAEKAQIWGNDLLLLDTGIFFLYTKTATIDYFRNG